MDQTKEGPEVVTATPGPQQKTKQNANNLTLFSHHIQKLTEEHGLTQETIRNAGLFSANSQELNALLGRGDIDPKIDGIVIPYDDNCIRARLTPPMIVDGNEAKYLSPVGAKNKLYIPKSVQAILQDTSHLLLFTEGELKALKGAQDGFFCIGLGGVYGFRSGGYLLEDFNKIELKNRNVAVVMDSDADFNFSVIKAGYSLAIELSKSGAKTRVLALPEISEETLND